MIPILYDQFETAFDTNGLGRLADCISCTVTEERNGIYECRFTYPVDGGMYSEIQEGRIIGVIHDDQKDVQPFDIYGHSAPLNGVVTFYAHHISYRLGSVILKPMSATSCAAAFAAIPGNTYNNCPFGFWTDKATSGTWQTKVPAAVKAILGGQQGSILDVYGKGEYQWDKWTVRLYSNRGNDNGVSIRYGVNLTDIRQDYDISGSYNAVAPYWMSTEDDTVVTLAEGIVVGNSGDVCLVPWTLQSGEEMTTGAGEVIYFEHGDPIVPVPMDLSDAFDEQPTQAQLKAEALRRLNSSEAWLPTENIMVKFVNLADTEEYRNVAALQRVSLCDKVSVYCGPLGVSAVKMQVVRVVYNVLTERYDEIELGKAKISFTQSITAQVEEMTKDLPSVSMMQRAINEATDQITGAKGGHLRFMLDANGELQEALIMDTDDISTATKVWRWNSGGFGFSSNGYAGPYALAMTMDGAIVANMITVGTALFNILKGGTLTLGGDGNGNGELLLKDGNGNPVFVLNNQGFNFNNGKFTVDTTGAVRAIDPLTNQEVSIDFGSIYFGHNEETRLYHSYSSADNEYILNIRSKSIRLYTYGDDGSISSYIDINSAKRIAAGVTAIQVGAKKMSLPDCLTGDIDAYGDVWVRDNLTVSGDLSVSGTKHRVVATDQYGERFLCCYETPTPMFGDIGDGVIGEDGLCYITLDAIFAQTITTDQYQVFLQKYGPGDCWIKERRGAYFVVEGTPGLEFGWEIKAKQRDYDQLRLERNDEKFTVPTQTFGEDAAQHIDEIRKEREAA